MLDIGIAVAIALLLAITAYLGTHLTMHPAETPRQKFWYKAGFAICGLVGCALIGIQTWRNNQTQDDLRGRLSRIEKNTKTPPNVQVTNNVPAPQIVFAPPTPATARIVLTQMISSYYQKGQRQGNDVCSAEANSTIALIVGQVVSFNVCFKNDGAASADGTRTIGKLYFAADSSAATQKALRGQFEKYLNQKLKTSTGSTFEPNSSEIFTTVTSDRVVTKDDPMLLIDRKEFLYMLLSATYTDRSGDHYQHYCRIFVPPQADQNQPITPGNEVFVTWETGCRVYGEHK
jgi:hypothetical protein